MTGAQDRKYVMNMSITVISDITLNELYDRILDRAYHSPLFEVLPKKFFSGVLEVIIEKSGTRSFEYGGQQQK